MKTFPLLPGRTRGILAASDSANLTIIVAAEMRLLVISKLAGQENLPAKKPFTFIREDCQVLTECARRPTCQLRVCYCNS